MTQGKGGTGLYRNPLSYFGGLVVAGSALLIAFSLTLSLIMKQGSPYIGILTYLVFPGFLFLGVLIFFVGIRREIRRRKRAGAAAVLPYPTIDLNLPVQRKKFAYALLAGFALLLLLSVVSYHAFIFTESVTFCGRVCHKVMDPEFTAYLASPHARVRCVDCHVGSGASWYVKSKLSGARQVLAVTFHTYPTPIGVPVRNLRPARETCEECHWPQKFVGNLEHTYNYFLTDETNTPFTVRLLMNVGGGDPTHGPVGGIHWHMNVGNKIEYIASDKERQKIPYVRVTELAQGIVTEFRTPKFTNAVDEASLRLMDCMDCHNRPAHRYRTPNNAVNLAIALTNIDSGLHWIKSNAVYVLTQPYTNETQALQSIATTLSQLYPNDLRIRSAIGAVQQIYTNNFFPEMKASWKDYPDNIGHKDWPGCFRCHDGLHKSGDGKHSIKADNCDACHTILAQGRGEEAEQLRPKEQKFNHPGDPVEGGCNDCHTGGL